MSLPVLQHVICLLRSIEKMHTQKMFDAYAHSHLYVGSGLGKGYARIVIINLLGQVT